MMMSNGVNKVQAGLQNIKLNSDYAGRRRLYLCSVLLASLFPAITCLNVT